LPSARLAQRRIHLPGAHNSAAYRLHHYALAPAGGAHPDWVGWLNSQSPTVTTPISQLAVPWADCQGESVADQLRHGVRYLDLRAVWVEGGAERRELGLGEGEADWLVTHTLLGGPIEDVFIQARLTPGAPLPRGSARPRLAPKP
jgi:hypothetical protein